jgi:hypothetical protein
LQEKGQGRQEMTTKRTIIAQAYGSVGLASYAFDLSSEEIAQAVLSLDAMMAQWNVRGARIGYVMGADPDLESGLPDWALEATWLNLGLRLAGAIGKPVMIETKAAAKQAFNSLMGMVANPPEMVLDRYQVPAGAGQYWGTVYDSVFLPKPVPGLKTGPDGPLDLE